MRFDPKKLKVTAKGLDLIRHFEDCLQPTGDGRFSAYPDPGYGWKVPTIGWGTIAYPDGRKVKKGDIITQDQADEYLEWEVGQKARAVRELVRHPITDDQFSALVSFSYNAGAGALSKSTLLKLLNAGDIEGAAGQFIRWNKSNGKTLDGLTRRRMSEARLFRGLSPFIVDGTAFRRWKQTGQL